MVPRLRIWKWPMNGVARASSGTARGHLGGRARWWPGRAGADPQGAVASLDRAQLLHPAQVDEVVEDGQAQGEHRHEALAAGDDLGGVAELGQQRDGLVDGGGRVVVERRRLHVAACRLRVEQGRAPTAG